jgi:hypothetical protein
MLSLLPVVDGDLRLSIQAALFSHLLPARFHRLPFVHHQAQEECYTHVHLSNVEYIAEMSQADHKPVASFTRFCHDCRWVSHSFLQSAGE